MTVVAYGVDHGVVCSLTTVQFIPLNDYIASTTLLRMPVYMQNVSQKSLLLFSDSDMRKMVRKTKLMEIEARAPHFRMTKIIPA